MKERKINILGTEYTLKGRCKTDPKMIYKDGYCDKTSKELVILDSLNIKDDINCVENPKIYSNSVIRHEVIHAFFYESGLDEFFNNELLVDWIAMQYPKIKKIFKELKIEE